MAIQHHAERRTAVRTHPMSFRAKAVLALVLYLVFWLPGFIANIVFLLQGRAAERDLGVHLPGVRFLRVLFWVDLVIVALVVLFSIVLWAATGTP